MARNRIYLDQRYWNFCRDAASGHPQKPEHVEILQALYDLVDQRIALCPVFYSVFAETMKLRHESRLVVARLIDRLSLGVAVQEPRNLALKELSHFTWTRLLGDTTSAPMAHYVFLPVAHLVGEQHPVNTGFKPEDELVLQKGFYEFMSTVTMEEVMQLLRDREPVREDDSEFQSRQNVAAARNRHRFRTFKEAFAIELDGVADIWEGETRAFVSELFERGHRIAVEVSPSSAVEMTRNLIAIVFGGLKLGRITTELPSIHIPTGIHAAIRHRRQKYVKGDLHDFAHATTALGYCDAFLTETRLANLLTQRPLQYDQIYQCRVMSEEREVLAYLRELQAGQNRVDH